MLESPSPDTESGDRSYSAYRLVLCEADGERGGYLICRGCSQWVDGVLSLGLAEDETVDSAFEHLCMFLRAWYAQGMMGNPH